MVHREPRRLGAAFRFLQPPPPRSPALQNANLPPAGVPPPAGPAPLHLRAAPPGPGDPARAGRASAPRPRARGGRGRACGRAPRRRGRGRAERAREGERAARRAALVQRGKPKYQFQTLGKHSAPRTAHALRHPPRPPPRGPRPRRIHAPHRPCLAGVWLCLSPLPGRAGVAGGKRRQRRRKLYYEFRTWRQSLFGTAACLPSDAGWQPDPPKTQTEPALPRDRRLEIIARQGGLPALPLSPLNL